MTCPELHFDAADPDVQAYGLGAAALRYQREGYAVLPLVRGGKKPHRMLAMHTSKDMEAAGRGGVYWADSRPEHVKYWWAMDPAANVGVATGQVSRLAVIDLDVKGGQDGPGELIKFLEQYKIPWPPLDAAHVRTPSGGWHLWLRTPHGVSVPERPGILPGVDVKGDGGLVAVPPSMILAISGWRPGEPRDASEVPVAYHWITGCPCRVPDAPAWVMPWLLSAPSQGSRAGTGGREIGESPDLTSLKATGIPRGQRNETMYRLACKLFRERGLTIEASVSVKEDLMAVWAAGDRSGFTPHELLTIIDSARRFVSGQMADEQMQIRAFNEWMNRGSRS